MGVAREVGISRKVWEWGLLQQDLVAPLKNNNNCQE